MNLFCLQVNEVFLTKEPPKNRYGLKFAGMAIFNLAWFNDIAIQSFTWLSMHISWYVITARDLLKKIVFEIKPIHLFPIKIVKITQAANDVNDHSFAN